MLFLIAPFLGLIAQDTGIDRQLLKGAWTSGGPSFDMLIQDSTILFEFDMKEHPYQLSDSLLIIDFEDPTLGMQTKKILSLTRDKLVFRDLQSETVGTYHRMRE